MSNDFILSLALKAAHHPDMQTALLRAVQETLPNVIEGILRSEFAGDTLRLYIPKNSPGSKQERAARIRAGFTGHNYAELAKQERISSRQVRRIIHAG